MRETCNVCHRPLTRRGNRVYWVRNTHWSFEQIVCGRKNCQRTAQDIPAGAVYSTQPYDASTIESQEPGR